VNLPVVLLKKNRSEEAWREFFSAMPLADPLRTKLAGKRWNGSNPAGKRILVSTDGLFGDSIWLSRFIPILRQRGAHAILQCQPALLPLIGPLADEAIPVGASQPDFDFYVPLGGLPLDLGFTSHPQPSGCPYLSPPADRRAVWVERIPRDGTPNIGLVWAGGESDKSRFRSHSFQVLAPLGELRGVRFFSLQKGEAASQKPPAGIELIDFTSELRDFADTAAMVERLDFVVGIDTAVMHVAAAQNIPAYALIPWRTSFLWLLDRDDSPWYPSMRLFRQTHPNDWENPARAMARALAHEISGRK
jgi:hypothetical protein